MTACHRLRTCLLLAIMAAALLSAPRLAAQTTTGSIYGTVADATGAVIPNATITLTDVDNNLDTRTQSNAQGAFTFPAVAPGNYRIVAAVAGFKTLTQRGIVLSANQNVNASFTLSAGAVSDSVTVEATNTLIDTRESQIGETIDQNRIESLPTQNRTAYDLVQIVPGVTNYTSAAAIGDKTGVDFTTNGIRSNLNSFYLDGALDVEVFTGGGAPIPNPDALQEFRLLTANFDAEFGRYPGGVANVITRSGTSSYHGTAYDYIRNNVLNAKPYFQTSIPRLVQNTFGGGFGGPLLLPHLLTRSSKAFFFLSYQGFRVGQSTIVNTSAIIVPTALERTGNFTQSPKKPNQTICPGYICTVNPVIANIIPLLPAPDPTRPGTANGDYLLAQESAPNPGRADQGTARLDFQVGAHALQFTYFNQQGSGYSWTAGSNTLFDYSGIATHDGQTNYVIGDTWVVSPKIVNSARIYYSLNKSLNTNAIAGYHWSDLGSQIRDGGGGVTTQPQMTITGFMGTIGVGGSGPSNQTQLNYGIQDTVNWDLGRHSIKMGGGFNLVKYDETASFLNDAKMTFNNSGPTGEALSDWITGHPTTFQQNNGSLHRVHSPDPSLFIADDWKVTRRLTANLGVRWEVYYPYAGQNNFGTFQAGVESKRFPGAPLGVLSAGDPGVPDGILLTSLTKFAPRVGFAWDVFGTGKTSVRGGYGLFYSASEETFIGNLEQAPFALSIALSPPAATANLVQIYGSSSADPFPYTVNLTNPTFPAGASYGGLPPHSSAVPYVQEYNLTVEQQYGPNWSSRLSFVGNGARKLFLAVDQNAPVYIPGASTTANTQSRRPLSSYSAIGLLDPASNSSFSSLQAVLTRRFAHGFSLLASYVWEKQFDIASSDPGSFTAYSLASEACVQCDRGLSTLETPQRFVASYIYKFPDVHFWGLVGREVASGWQVNGITTLSTGGPFNILSNVDSNDDGIATDRPNQIADPRIPGARTHAQKIAQYFNTAAFVAPAANSGPGNAHRDPVVGPGYINTDVSAFKRFALFDHSDLLFRGELFNLFNNVNFGNPNGTVGNGSYGKITGTSQPRIVQFALKLEF
jgi:hypothetical protein